MPQPRTIAMLCTVMCLLVPASFAQADPSTSPSPSTSTSARPATSAPASSAAPDENGPLASRYIITRAVAGDSSSIADGIAPEAAAVKAKVVESRVLASGDEVVVLDRALDPLQSQQFLQALERQPGVLRAEVDALLTPLTTSSTWVRDAMKATGTPGAGGDGVNVAVIDTGVIAHPALRTVGGYDFVSDPRIAHDGGGRDADATDPGDGRDASTLSCGASTSSTWHGTQVASVIAGAATGAAGIAPRASLIPIRALGRCGGYTSDIIDAVLWAAGAPVRGVPTNQHPAHVVTLAFGGAHTCATSVQNALNQAVAKGVTLVAAAGNAGTVTAPANCSNVISVGATTRNGTVASYSPSADVDLFAPGGDAEAPLTVASGRGTRQLTGTTVSTTYGTSLAAAHVAGVVALVRSTRPELMPGQIENLLARTASGVTGCASCKLVNASAALAAAQRTPTNPGSTSGSIPTAPAKPGSSATMPSTTGDPTTPSTNVIVNGTFEAGAKGWRGDTGTINSARDKAAQGRFKAWLLGYGRPGAEQISQPVAIPSGSKHAALSFALSIASEETKPYAYDTMVVRVFDWNGRYLGTLATYTNVDAAPGYLVKNLDMSQYIGQKIQIQFGAVEDRSLRTSFLLDDVELKVS